MAKKPGHFISFEVEGHNYTEIEAATYKVLNDYFPHPVDYEWRIDADVRSVDDETPKWHAWVQAWEVTEHG